VHVQTLLALVSLWPACHQDPAVPPTAPPQDAKPDATTPAPLTPKEEKSKFLDPDDGYLDLSRFLEHPVGFVPIVVPITDPALGFGAVAGAVFLDPREDAGGAGWSRPNMTFAGGLWTDDGSDGLFAGNSTIWGDGDFQTLVGAGNLGLELSLYGIGDDPALDGRSIDYHLEVDALLAEARHRLGKSDFWGGLRFVYASTEVEFEQDPGGLEGVGAGDGDVTLAGPAVTLRYDSLDNMMTPTRGLLSDTSVSVYDDVFGASQDFQMFQEVLIHHWTLSDSLFLGVRGQFDASFGDTPFYARPYIAMRGIPSLRYQGEEVLSGEAELRWRFHPRWSVVGFGGVGVAWNDLEEFESQQEAASGGFGFRYLVARKFGLLAGLDAAWGPEDGVVYVQFGNAWIRP
jgi:hypothetical protein